MTTMDPNANDTEKQAVAAIRMDLNLAQVERIATARKWRGNVKKRFVNRYLSLKAQAIKAL